MKHQPSRNVCFARDRYYLQKEIRAELLSTSNQAGCENKFRRGVTDLMLKHKGYIDSHHRILPLSDGSSKVLKHSIIRFNDNTTAAIPHVKSIYTESSPFVYHAQNGESIPADWLPKDYDVSEA